MRLSIEIPYADIDAMGHLNNVASVRYLEWARQKYWLAMRGSVGFLFPAAFFYRLRHLGQRSTWKSFRKVPGG